jgi:hypothetical protein
MLPNSWEDIDFSVPEVIKQNGRFVKAAVDQIVLAPRLSIPKSIHYVKQKTSRQSSELHFSRTDSLVVIDLKDRTKILGREPLCRTFRSFFCVEGSTQFPNPGFFYDERPFFIAEEVTKTSTLYIEALAPEAALTVHILADRALSAKFDPWG